MNCRKVYKVLEQHMLPSRSSSISGKALCIQPDNAKPLQILQQHGFVVEESGC